MASDGQAAPARAPASRLRAAGRRLLPQGCACGLQAGGFGPAATSGKHGAPAHAPERRIGGRIKGHRRELQAASGERLSAACLLLELLERWLGGAGWFASWGRKNQRREREES